MAKIVERFTWKVKWGHEDEFLELTKAERERFGESDDHGIYRLFTCNFGPMSTVIGDWVFENEEQQEKAWAEWWPQPGAQEWREKVDKLIESCTHEIWYEH